MNFSHLFIPLCVALLTASCAAPAPADAPSPGVMPVVQPAPLRLDESSAKLVLNVDGDAANANDQNSGASDAPFRTIQAAVDFAVDGPLKRGEPTKIVVRAGVYRQGVKISTGKVNRSPNGATVEYDRAADTLLIVEGEKPNAVFVRGTDEIPRAQWRREADGVYSATAPAQFDFVAGRFGQYNPPQVLGHRREMVFLGGAPLREVNLENWDYQRPKTPYGQGSWEYRGFAGLGPLEPGTFGVTTKSTPGENGDRVWIRLPAGTDWSASRVEVAARGGSDRIKNERDGHSFLVNLKHNLVIRNFNIEGWAHPIDGYAGLQIGGEPPYSYGVRNVLVENCVLRWNNNDGLDLMAAQMVHLKNVRVENNGGRGIGGAYLLDSVFDEVSVTDNGWRYAQGGGFGWIWGGLKLWCSGRNLYRNSRFSGNWGHGFWLDGLNYHSTWQNCEFSGNSESGLFIEISEGPFEVANSRMTRNHEAGLRLTSSRQVWAHDNAIVGNVSTQIQFPTKSQGRDVAGKNEKTPADPAAVVAARRVPDASVLAQGNSMNPWKRVVLPKIELADIVLERNLIGTDLTAAQLKALEESELRKDLTTWTGYSLLVSPRRGVGGNDAFEKRALPQIIFRGNRFFSPDMGHAFALINDASQVVSLDDFAAAARFDGDQVGQAGAPAESRALIEALAPLRDRRKELGWAASSEIAF